MSGLGEWQERLTAVLAAAELLDAILYFDNLAELMSEGADQGGVDMAAMLRNHLQQGRLRLVAEITSAALERAERRHPALLGALDSLRVAPLTPALTRAALVQHCQHWQRRDVDAPQVDAAVIEPLVRLCERYLPYRAFPGKAIDTLLRMRAQLSGESSGGQAPAVTLSAVYQWFAQQSGVPLALLRDDLALHKAQVVAALAVSMVGQHKAVARVADTLCVVKARLQPPDKPLCTFLFVGPTGVGKTQLARSLAGYLFNDPQRMVRFDMSEYADGYSAQRLIAGNDREAGLLTSKVREQPFCVLLFDEIEKAHPLVHDMLLQVLGEARLSDARGRTSYFHNAIIIMTSNLGVSHQRHSLGLLRREPDVQQHYLEAVSKAFRPELVNRLDRVIAFAPLSMAEVKRVVALNFEGIAQRRGLKQLGVSIGLSDAAATLLAERGHSVEYGARALRRALERLLVTPLSSLLVRLGAEAKGCFVWFAVHADPYASQLPAKQRLLCEEHGELRFEVYQRPQAGGRQVLFGVDRVAHLRRRADEWMATDEARHIVDQRDFLRAQLATFEGRKGKRKRKRKAVIEVQALQQRHHLLQQACEGAQLAQEEVATVEQLCIGAMFDGEHASELVGEAERAYGRFVPRYFYLLTAERRDRNACTLMVHQLDGHQSMRAWVLPLVQACRQRNWQLQVHARRVAPIPGENWPEQRLWSSARDINWLETEVTTNDQEIRGYLLRINGRDAGVVLPLEVGLHRFGDIAEEVRHLSIKLVTLHAGGLHEDVWKHELLTSAPPTPPRARAVAVRERLLKKNLVRIRHKERAMSVRADAYFPRLEEIVLQHYLHHQQADSLAELYVEQLPRPLVTGGLSTAKNVGPSRTEGA